MATVGKYQEKPTGDGAHVATARKFVMRRPKVRGGGVDEPVRYELRGEKDRPNGATLTLAITLPTEEYDDAETLAAACEGQMSRKGLADALRWNTSGKRFESALADALDRKLLRRVERGVYERGEATE